MDYKKLSLGLGVFSIALGAAELFASRRITRALEADGHEKLVQGYGLREVAAGVGLLQAPAHPARMWNRVAGDVLDLATLAFAVRNAPRNKAVWGAVAFVVGAGLLDTLVARGLDVYPSGDTDQAASVGEAGTERPGRADRAHNGGRDTSIEPVRSARGTAPVVA